MRELWSLQISILVSRLSSDISVKGKCSLSWCCSPAGPAAATLTSLLTEESCSGVVPVSVTIKGSCHGEDNIRFMHMHV